MGCEYEELVRQELKPRLIEYLFPNRYFTRTRSAFPDLDFSADPVNEYDQCEKLYTLNGIVAGILVCELFL